jgi:DNA-binding transcriptional regulator YdaS (Cro superfamily)
VDLFWARVKGRLDAAERSQAWLARRLGVSRSLVNQWMLGRVAIPTERRQQVIDVMGIAVPEEEVAA